jgi:hypothetical protein
MSRTFSLWFSIIVTAAILMIYFLGFEETIVRLTVYVVQSIVILFPVIFGLRNASNGTLSNRFSWYSITLGIAFWGIGNLIFAYYDITKSEKPFPSIADIFFLSFYLLVSLGLLSRYRSQDITLSMPHKSIVLIVFILTFTAGFIIGKENFFNPEVALLERLLNFIYTTADAILLASGLVMFLCMLGGRLARPWLYFGIGILCMYIADINFSLLSNINGSDQTSISDGLWLISFLYMGIAFEKEKVILTELEI